MKISEVLTENAAVGSVAGAAIAGFRGSLFGGPIQRERIPNPLKVQKIRYSKKKDRNAKG